MNTTDLSNLPEIKTYWQYVKECTYDLDIVLPSRLIESVRTTNWEDPQTALDFNNIAVMSLIEADNAKDPSERSLYWEFALESLKQGVELPNSYLCKANLSMVFSLIDDLQTSIHLAFNYFLETLQLDSTLEKREPLGLMYLPRHSQKWKIICQEQLPNLLQASDSISQAISLTLQTICHSRLAFYNSSGLRFLQLATQFNTDSAILNLQLGISGLEHQQLESLAYLHRARKLAPQASLVIQALYLAYRDLQKLDIAEKWKEIATRYSQSNPDLIEWKWVNLGIDNYFTYISFEDSLCLAVESSLKSIVTMVLIAQQDWFESEMELWRTQIQPGMTIIDVGANVGVYTYSAAQRVGESGKVIAIEPFSSCVKCLEETRRINKLDWVSIVAGAASDTNGTVQLFIDSLSELNKLVHNDIKNDSPEKFETVACFTLDSLIDKENLSRVDWIKIDAEGHEMQVLHGCDQILQKFRPKIIYENILGEQQNNTGVAEYLVSKGYQLFYYRPYLQQLIPIDSQEDFKNSLNIVALPTVLNVLEDSYQTKKILDNTSESSQLEISITSTIQDEIQEDKKQKKSLDSYKIVMVVSGGLNEFIENTIKSIQNCSISLSHVEIFTPRVVIPTLEKLKTRYGIGNITAIEDITANQFSLSAHNNYYNYGTSNFASFTINKWIAIKHLFEQGVHNVIYTDVDIAWIQNPLYLLESTNHICDIAVQTEGYSVVSMEPNCQDYKAYLPLTFCTGFMSFINTEFCLTILDALIESQINLLKNYPECHDQVVFNEFVNSNLHILNKIFPLSEILFANGLSAKRIIAKDDILDRIITNTDRPLIFHANCTVGLKNKKIMLQRTGNWFLDDEQSLT